MNAAWYPAVAVGAATVGLVGVAAYLDWRRARRSQRIPVEVDES